jgi:hypothetical protein
MSQENELPSCIDCFFWVEKQKQGVTFAPKLGECRRHSPTPQKNTAGYDRHIFPIVYFDTWCGDFEEKEEV